MDVQDETLYPSGIWSHLWLGGQIWHSFNPFSSFHVPQPADVAGYPSSLNVTLMEGLSYPIPMRPQSAPTLRLGELTMVIPY